MIYTIFATNTVPAILTAAGNDPPVVTNERTN